MQLERADGVSQPHAQAGAIHRGRRDRALAPAEEMRCRHRFGFAVSQTLGEREIQRVERRADRLRGRRRVRQLHAPDVPRQGGGVLARHVRECGARRADGARGGGRDGRDRRHRAGHLGAAGEPAASRRHREDARASASASAGRGCRAARRRRAQCSERRQDAAGARYRHGSDGERLYARHGWQRCGEIPDYALWPDGRPCATTIFFKFLRN